MSKKKEFHLRTVLATGWIEPKSSITLHAFFNADAKSNIRLKTSQSPRKRRIVTEEKETNIIIKNKFVSKS